MILQAGYSLVRKVIGYVYWLVLHHYFSLYNRISQLCITVDCGCFIYVGIDIEMGMQDCSYIEAGPWLSPWRCNYLRKIWVHLTDNKSHWNTLHFPKISYELYEHVGCLPPDTKLPLYTHIRVEMCISILYIISATIFDCWHTHTHLEWRSA